MYSGHHFFKCKIHSMLLTKRIGNNFFSIFSISQYNIKLLSFIISQNNNNNIIIILLLLLLLFLIFKIIFENYTEYIFKF